MKTIKNLFLGVISLFVISCNSLNIEPVDIITDRDILTNEVGINAYMAGLYKKLPMEDFNYYHARGWARDWNVGGKQSGSAVLETYGSYSNCEGMEGFGYWPYPEIRDVNYFIDYLTKNRDSYLEADFKSWMSEAHFIRAFYYFGLAKRYGGVPIIKEVQDVFDTPEALMPARDKEVDVWNFIKKELILAYDLPETSESGKANRYVAAALMSRAMLYAGTIAKYGKEVTVTGEALDKGLVGIPSTEAKDFFQTSYEAAELIMDSPYYELYKVTPNDLVKNYCDIFLDEKSKENIFIRAYSKSSETNHCWDMNMIPKIMCNADVCNAYPSMNTIELFQKLDVINPDGTPRRYEKRSGVMNGIEPRLKAITFFPGEILNGIEFDLQRGIYEHFDGMAEDEMVDNEGQRPNRQWLHKSNNHQEMYKDKLIIGLAGMAERGEESQTGFYRRKYLDYRRSSEDLGWWASTQSYIEFRLAEIMLNKAEAAFELGDAEKITLAKADIQAIRARAGASKIDNGDIDLNEVRRERRRELAFENHIAWDLKRWRIAHKELDHAKIYSLMPYYIYDENRFIFLRQRAPGGREYTFRAKWYYERLPQAELAKNPNLYPNNPEY